MAGEWISTLELAAQPDAVRWARHHAVDVLASWRVAPAAVGDVELIVSELVTNAVQSAARFKAKGGPWCIAVVLQWSQAAIRVAVYDPNPALPVPVTDTEPDAENGRGLYLVTSLAKQWGAAPTYGGKCVWCVVATELPLSSPRKPTHAPARA